MRRQAWEQVGGFPEHLRSAEDLLFMRKIDNAGLAVSYEPAAVVHWNLQPRLWHTFKRFVTYSLNNIRANLWREWQAPVFKRYALLLVSALPVLAFGYKWLLFTLALWLAMLAARAIVAIWRNRTCYPGSIFKNVVRLLVLIPLLAMLDAATIMGTLQWAVRDKAGL